MSVFSLLRSAVAATLLLAAFAAHASVGLIQFSAGDVKIRNAAGQLRDAAKGGTVDEGDTILTAAASSAQLKMADGGIIAVRPETELQVATYRYAGKEDGTERAVMSLVKGGFRTITGLIGRTNKQNYTISTPTAVIGIRGTDHEPIVVPAIAGAGKASAPPGTYDKVNVGQAYIKTPLGEVNIRQNQVGYAAPNQAPTLLPKVPDMFRATPPVRQAQAASKEEQQKQESQKQEQQKQQSASSRTSAGSQSNGSGDKPEAQSTQTASSGSSDSSTSSASGAGASSTSEVRATAAVDSTPTTASTGSAATTTAVVATTTLTSAITTATTTAAPLAVVQEVKGRSSDDSAATVNLTTQTTITSTGATSTIQDTTSSSTTTTPTTVTPSVATSTYGALIASQAPVSTSSKNLEGVSKKLQPNSAYVLDQANTLTEIKHITHQTSDTTGVVQTIDDADLKMSGGKTADVYVDSTKTMYIGRQEGGSINVTPNSGGGSSFTQSLNNSSAHWLIAVQPGLASLPNGVGTISNVQNVVGTSVFGFGSSLTTATPGTTVATHPTDLQGNVGTLQSAFVIANFSSQTVNTAVDVKFSTTDTAAISKRNFEIIGAATNVPIKLGGFDAVAGTSTAPVAACIGADCNGNLYQGTIRGLFGAQGAGATGIGTNVGISYSFSPSIASGTSFPDLVQGTAVLSSVGVAPTAGAVATFAGNTNVRHELLYDTFQANSTSAANVAVARDTISLTAPTVQTVGGAHANSNYLFDSSGHLVRIFDTPYAIFDHGNNLTSTSAFTVPTPLVHASVSMGGYDAVALDLFSDTTAGIALGRWKGGEVNVTDLSTGNAYVEALGSRSVQWLVRAAPTSLPVSGAYQYTKMAGTAPTDSYGNAGTLDRARLNVDFSRNTVSAGVAITMPSGSGGSLGTQNLSAHFTDAPLTSSGFNVSSNSADNPASTDFLHVNCFGTGCAANQTYGGRIRGGLSSGSGLANAAEGAYFRYTFNTSYGTAAAASTAGRNFDDYIEGLVAFKQGPSVIQPSVDVTGTVSGTQTTVSPPADASVVYAYNFTSSGILQSRSEQLYAQGGTGYQVDSAGRLVSVTGYFDNDKSLSGSNPVSSPTPQKVTVNSGTTPFDIVYGYYGQPTLTGIEKSSSYTRTADTLQWIRAPGMYPFYLSMVATNPTDIVSGTTVAYANVGGLVTDGTTNGNLTAATLSVNFNSQTVDAGVKATVGPNSWDASANGIQLEGLGSFSAFKGGSTQHSIGTLTLNGNSTNVGGNIRGALVGPQMQGAGIVFDFFSTGTTTGPRAMGSAVFGSPTYANATSNSVAFTPSPAVDYHLGLVASGMNSVGALTSTAGGTLSQENNYRVDIGAVSPSRTQFVDYQTTGGQNPAGSLVKFDGAYPYAFGCSGTVCSGADDMNVRYAVTDATGSGPLPGNGTATIPAPTAKVLESGYDAATGMRWGRWGGGSINVGDRATNSGGGTVPTANGTGTTNQIDLSVNNWHYLITGVQSGPVVLPVSGTATYQLIGATSPTAYKAGQTAIDVGSLTSASLVANFTAKTVDVAVNATTPGSGSWTATANAIPILKDTAFSIDRKLSDTTSSLAITRTVNGAASSANTAGKIVGGFAGQTGQGAGIAYSLNQGGATGVTVSGVAAFKRP